MTNSKTIMTSEKQKLMTPSDVIEELKQGNQRYVQNTCLNRDFPTDIKQTSNEQYPKAVILSCIDSRVPVEYIFDQGIGDVFVSRVAGNVSNSDILGSMEYACKFAGAKLIVVLGHENCGAVKAAIDKVDVGNITGMLHKIQPAIQKSKSYDGDQTTQNHDYVGYVTEQNVRYTIDEIRSNSQIINELESNGEIMIVGAIYSLSTGRVSFFDKR